MSFPSTANEAVASASTANIINASAEEKEANESTEEEEEEEEKRDDDVQIMKSMCMHCGGTGTTRMLMHEIPYFRKLFIASFECDECGEYNNEVTFGGEIQLQGLITSLTVTKKEDLDRQLIKSDSATVKFKELDFEIPPNTQKGGITTIEGVLKVASSNLLIFQHERMVDNPEVGAKVQNIIDQLDRMAIGNLLPFTLSIDDPSGNSFIENPTAPAKDPMMNSKFYFRTPEQDTALGLQPNTGVFKDDSDSNFKALMMGEFGGEVGAAGGNAAREAAHKKRMADAAAAAAASSEPAVASEPVVVETESGGVQLGRNEIISLPGHCPHCHMLGESLTCVADIPHFKEVIIMSFDCASCGFRNNEVKGGGAIPTLGTEVKLVVSSPEDLKRDVLKSDSAAVSIPELDLELSCGTLGGMYTTVEGLLTKIHKSLYEQNSLQLGDSKRLHHSNDSKVQSSASNFEAFLDKLLTYSKGEHMPFTVVIRDPLGNSFISAPLGSFLAVEDDEPLSVMDFVRTESENEEFGLLDMNTADYEVIPEGAQHPSSEVVYADRVTRVVKKGADHPSFFAKGCEINDNTTGGAFMSSKEDAAGGVETGVIPAGWTFSKMNEHGEFIQDEEKGDEEENSKEEESKEDSRVKTEGNYHFIPSATFAGKKEGYIFQAGEQGTGYYQDKPQEVEVSETVTAADVSESA